MRAFWDALYDHGADIALAGHSHVYERFAPQTPSGKVDWDHGIRQFVVSSGGIGHHAFGAVKPNSQVRNARAYGVLKLTLKPGGYEWRFVPAAGQSFRDSGSGSCHGRPA